MILLILNDPCPCNIHHPDRLQILEKEKQVSGVVRKVKSELDGDIHIRLYIKDEQPNIEIGDDITIHYTPSGEKMTTKFICYGKQGLDKDNGELVTHYNTEDDKKVLCLMIDEKTVNYSNEIPFIRTLFKTGRHFEYQLIKREELLFVIDKNDIVLDYYDTSF